MANRFDARSTRNGDDDTATRAEARLGGLLDRVPGYRGYRDKEDRRDADRAVRESVGSSLDAAAARVQAVASDLATRRRIREVGPVDGWVRALQSLAQRVRLAPAGYGGIFTDQNIDAIALDQIRQFDEGLLAEVARVEDPIEALEAALVAEGDLAAPVTDGMAVMRSLATRFDARETVSTTGEALPETRVREVLSVPVDPSPPAAWELDNGTALSVTGDDFVVDARIDIEAGPVSMRLFRLARGASEAWLMVTAGATAKMAYLRAVPVPTSVPAPGAGTPGTAELIGVGGSSGVRPVTLSLDGDDAPGGQRTVQLTWSGDEAMVLSGPSVEPSEVEIYGPPSLEPGDD